MGEIWHMMIIFISIIFSFQHKGFYFKYKYNGQKAQTVMLELFPWTDSATLSWYLQEKTNRYHTLIENYGITPLDGVIDFLEYLHKNCIKCGIASSSRSAKFVAEKSWIAQYMQVTVTGNDIKNSKPDPEIFLLAADRLGVSYQNCVVFEDAASGMTPDEAHIAVLKEQKMLVCILWDFRDPMIQA